MCTIDGVLLQFMPFCCLICYSRCFVVKFLPQFRRFHADKKWPQKYIVEKEWQISGLHKTSFFFNKDIIPKKSSADPSLCITDENESVPIPSVLASSSICFFLLSSSSSLCRSSIFVFSSWCFSSLSLLSSLWFKFRWTKYVHAFCSLTFINSTH